jgi:hypothetical protein
LRTKAVERERMRLDDENSQGIRSKYWRVFSFMICLFLKKIRGRYKYRNIWHVYTIYTDKRQKTYDMYIQFTQTKDKKHMTCIYNVTATKNIWHVYTIYTDKRQKTYDMYIQFTQTKYI